MLHVAPLQIEENVMHQAHLSNAKCQARNSIEYLIRSNWGYSFYYSIGQTRYVGVDRNNEFGTGLTKNT